MTRINRRAVRWLDSQLPQLVSEGVITSENADSLRRHYQAEEARSTSLGFVLLAIVGSALVAAGIILIIAHNWDDLSRPLRSVIAFLPLIISQALALFVLLRRNDSQAWRESVAIFNVAAVATAIALISQTYQLQGSFADFLRIWLLLSIPIVYLFRTTVGAAAYIMGTVAWVLSKFGFTGNLPGKTFFWLLLVLVVPYYIGVVRRDRASREFKALSILLVVASAIGLVVTVEFARADLGQVAFAGFFTAVYLFGMMLQPADVRSLNVLSFLGGLGIGVTAIVLSFADVWHFRTDVNWAAMSADVRIGVAIQLLFPIVAIALALWTYLKRKRIPYAVAAAALPIVASVAWIIANMAPADRRSIDSPYSITAAILFNVYALALGVELLTRGIRAGSVARANFGLLIIAALASARFFDSEMSFVTRGLGFIAVGAGFLIANLIFFKRQRTA